MVRDVLLVSSVKNMEQVNKDNGEFAQIENIYSCMERNGIFLFSFFQNVH